MTYFFDVLLRSYFFGRIPILHGLSLVKIREKIIIFFVVIEFDVHYGIFLSVQTRLRSRVTSRHNLFHHHNNIFLLVCGIIFIHNNQRNGIASVLRIPLNTERKTGIRGDVQGAGRSIRTSYANRYLFKTCSVAHLTLFDVIKDYKSSGSKFSRLIHLLLVIFLYYIVEIYHLNRLRFLRYLSHYGVFHIRRTGK